MASDVEIVNQALKRIGQTSIVSLDEGTRNADEAKAIYAFQRDELLRGYRWKFASKRDELPALAEAPISGWRYAYQIPGDSLRVLSVNEIEADDPYEYREAWDREGNTIVTNEPPLIKIRYIRQVTNSAEFDMSFAAALAAKLAHGLAPGLRQFETASTKTLWGEYQETLAQARRTSAIEGRLARRDRPQSTWVYGRRW